VDVAHFAAPPAPWDRAGWRRELAIPPAALLVTTVCRLYKPRDFPTLLTAFAGVRRSLPAAHLLVVGDGPDRPALEAQVKSLELHPAVSLPGWRTDLPAVCAASDVYTLTTWGWEGLPLTVLEAMAAGLPVVATRAGGIPEAVVEHSTGILVERGDVASLEDALVRLLGDGELRRRLGAAGRQRSQQQFSTAVMVQKIDALYRTLL
jgi:glycosyltransferase involved in cell wall biosynthesis